MKLKEAIEILMEAGARDCIGSGCGIPSLPSQRERMKIAFAWHRAFMYVHNRPPKDSERYNARMVEVDLTEYESFKRGGSDE